MTETTETAVIATEYKYDKLGQLTEEKNGNVIETYAYDIYGNRSSNGNITYTYDKNNRMTKVDDGSDVYDYEYDNNGNLTKSNVFEYNYDTFNRLKSTSLGSYDYRPDGLRNSKTVEDVKTTHMWDGQSIVMDIDGVNNKKFIRGIGLFIDNTHKDYYLKDGHGNVKQLLNVDTKEVTQSYGYDAFGVSDSNFDDTNPLRYCGEYTDLESGLVYLRARYYSPMAGRFLTEDPIRSGMNWYVYCNNNPVNFVDPSGLSAELDWGRINSIIAEETAKANAIGRDRYEREEAARHGSDTDVVYLVTVPTGHPSVGKAIYMANQGGSVAPTKNSIVGPSVGTYLMAGYSDVQYTQTHSTGIVRIIGGTIVAQAGIKLSYARGIVWDDKGHIGLIDTGSFGGGWLGLGVSIFYAQVNAPHIENLQGKSVEVGGGASPIPVGVLYGVPITVGGTIDKTFTGEYSGMIYSAGFSAGIAIDGHGQISYSDVSSSAKATAIKAVLGPVGILVNNLLGWE